MTTQFEAKSPKISPSWREQDQSSVDFFRTNSDKIKRKATCVQPAEEWSKCRSKWPGPLLSGGQVHLSQARAKKWIRARSIQNLFLTSNYFQEGPHGLTSTKSHLDIRGFISPTNLPGAMDLFQGRQWTLDFFLQVFVGEMGKQFLSICPTTEQTLCKSMTLICQVCFLTPMVTIIVWK